MLSLTLDRQTISDTAGTLSFIVWLFAQSPQIYENYRRGSIEGLSPVFLTQWMLGDATNLIGCVLTQQLPFQIAVATYFCCIDACIMVQYGYYWRKARRERKKAKKASLMYAANPYAVLSETTELLGSRSRQNSNLRINHPHHRRNLSLSHVFQHTPHTASASITRTTNAAPLSSTRSYYHRSKSRQPISRSTSTDTHGDYDFGYDSQSSNYRAMSNAALSVAQLAQEAARRREAHTGLHEHAEDYFAFPLAAHRSDGSHSKSRSRSRANSSSQPPIAAATASTSAIASVAGERRSRTRRKGNGDFVPSALSPTREVKDGGETTDAEEEDHDVSPSMLDSTSSLGTTNRDADGLERSIDSLPEPRGRDMTRMAARLESQGNTTPVAPESLSGAATPCSSSSTTPSGDTAKGNPSRPTEGQRQRTQSEELSRSHHQFGYVDDKRDVADVDGEALDAIFEENGRALHESLGTLPHRFKRSSSSRSNTGGRRSGTKSPASMRRSIGMVLLGVMLLTLPPDSASAAAVPHSLSSGASTTSSRIMSALIGGPDASWERVIGRISAWTCTVLYITSRIPQIWENYLRRSVEGLSILLFISAFTGNLLYTISVLTSPQAVGTGARAYLQESIPFLLGSGGTLIFDGCIFIQYYLWAGRKAELVDGDRDETTQIPHVATVSSPLTSSELVDPRFPSAHRRRRVRSSSRRRVLKNPRLAAMNHGETGMNADRAATVDDLDSGKIADHPKLMTQSLILPSRS